MYKPLVQSLTSNTHKKLQSKPTVFQTHGHCLQNCSFINCLKVSLASLPVPVALQKNQSAACSADPLPITGSVSPSEVLQWLLVDTHTCGISRAAQCLQAATATTTKRSQESFRRQNTADRLSSYRMAACEGIIPAVH